MNRGGNRSFHRGGMSNRGRGSGGRGGRPPRGLRGRDIGLFYARRQRENTAKNRSVISIPERHEAELADIVKDLQDVNFERDFRSHESFMSAYKKNIQANMKREDGTIYEGSSDDTVSDNDEACSERLRLDFEKKADQTGYNRMLEFRTKLPAFKMSKDLLALIRDNQVVVVSGETGCGKTTQVPQFILDDMLERGEGAQCRIVCTQPRRISAITIAERVAEERDEAIGKSVGYQIRLESRLPREQGSIIYCTTGVTLQWMRTNPTLAGVSHIVLDEIHERDILSDFLMTFLKEVLSKRKDLKVILMSATLNAHSFSKYFWKAPVINIPGRTFPVKQFFLEDVLEMTGFEIRGKDRGGGASNAPVWHKHTKKGKMQERQRSEYEDFIEPFLRDIESSGQFSRRTVDSLSYPESEEINLELIATLVHHINDNEKPGAILVFLPGWDQISTLNKLLTEDRRYEIRRNSPQIFPLHSLMPTVSQKAIFRRPPGNVRKIVIATNIAETSITIDDVVYVIDCGKIKMTNFDVENNISTFKPEWVSLANASQRRGRAGRVQPGICYHLFTRAREMTLDRFIRPEMLRTKLDEVILHIKILELGAVASFLERVMEPPEPNAVRLAIESLQTIHALTEEGEQLTPLGFHLAQLPMDPQTGKMILLGAIFSCLDPILSIAASLSFKDPFVIPLGKEQLADRKRFELAGSSRSDHLMLANAISGWEGASADGHGRDYCWNYFLSESTLRMLANMKRQFAEHLHQKRFVTSADPKADESNINSDNESLVRAIVCAGLYPNVAKINVRSSKHRGRFATLSTVQERRVEMHPKSVNAKQADYQYPYMVYHLKMKSTSTFIYDGSMVSPLPLIFFGRSVNLGVDRFEIETISVDRFLTFNCAHRTGRIVKNLRTELDKLLEYKVTHPGKTVWDVKTKEGLLLNTLVDLLTCEVEGVSTDGFEDDEYCD